MLQDKEDKQSKLTQLEELLTEFYRALRDLLPENAADGWPDKITAADLKALSDRLDEELKRVAVQLTDVRNRIKEEQERSAKLKAQQQEQEAEAEHLIQEEEEQGELEDNLVAEAAALRKKLAELNDRLASLQAGGSRSLAEIKRLEEEIGALEKKIAAAKLGNDQLKKDSDSLKLLSEELSKKIADKKRHLAQLNTQVDQAKIARKEQLTVFKQDLTHLKRQEGMLAADLAALTLRAEEDLRLIGERGERREQVHRMLTKEYELGADDLARRLKAAVEENPNRREATVR